MRVAPSPDGDSRIYVEVSPRLDAGLARPIWYQLLDLALVDSADDADRIGIWAGGVWFDLSALAGVGS